jgi:hypothetical protein
MSSKRKGNQKHDAMTDPSIAKLFEGKNFAFLATLMKDGTPHVSILGEHQAKSAYY